MKYDKSITTQVIDDLKATIDVLNTKHWVQGSMFSYNRSIVTEPITPEHISGCCAFGAMVIATGEAEGSLFDRDRSSMTSRAFYRVMGVDITNYNDSPGRTKQQMINALNHVITKIEENPSAALG